MYLAEEQVEATDVTPYYDKVEHCIALPLVVSLGSAVIACKMKLSKEVIMECLDDVEKSI